MLARYKHCPTCGEENPPNAADCVRCGADILSEPVERRVIPSDESTPDSPTPRDSAAAGGLPPMEGDHLILEALAAPGKSFVVRDGQTVGRSDQADVVIEDVPELDSVSRRMATFFHRNGQWYVQHIATTNYIAVDGEQYEEDDEVAIRDGSVLGLALCQFIVRVAGHP